MFPLNPLVSTVLRTTGTSKTLAALQWMVLLLIMDWRSKFATPKSICGCRSMMVTTQLSGVSSPFSLRLASLVLFGMAGLLSIGLYESFARDPRRVGGREENHGAAMSRACPMDREVSALPLAFLLNVDFSCFAFRRPLSADQCLPSPKTARRLRPLSR